MTALDFHISQKTKKFTLALMHPVLKRLALRQDRLVAKYSIDKEAA